MNYLKQILLSCLLASVGVCCAMMSAEDRKRCDVRLATFIGKLEQRIVESHNPSGELTFDEHRYNCLKAESALVAAVKRP